MKHLGSASVLALCAMAAPALADVTPQQVWDNLEGYMASSGYAVTATESMSGGTLTVSDISMTVDIPEEDGTVSVNMGEMSFADKGDGSVEISWPASMPIGVMIDVDGEKVEVGLDYITMGGAMTASGTTDAMAYDYSADSISLVLSKLNVEGEEITRDMATFEMVMSGLGGNMVMSMADGMRMISQTLNGAGLTITGMASEPGTENGGNFSLAMAAFESSSESMVPGTVDYTDMPAMLAAGFAGAGEFSHSGVEMAFDVTDRGDNTNGSISTSSGRMAFAMSQDAMSFDGGNTDMTVAMQGAEIPLPISGKMAETSFNVSMPLQKSDTPQDAAIGLTLGGFETSDMIWGMLDPGGVLPRDPATVSADLTAKVTPFVSLLNEEEMMKVEMGEMMPGELNAVTLNALTVEAAGGKITGDGDFTFDNTDLTSFDGFPAPEGKLNLSVSGANGLIDKIIAMGLMSQEDAMGARMMLSMFTVPGSAPDSATSTIEFNDQGHILANGQRIK
ncbi:DUF2125 domain-containing protein [Pacificoceanicola onchidii]|uniref:DUF2125 domain-containing protein n=1 Tax=Pacificoceanicola onchidii TaxID=2562685 RepID=UPI001456115C|nr:DUF2125 domain-containing protein [Pacificoceanicola onchidii]